MAVTAEARVGAGPAASGTPPAGQGTGIKTVPPAAPKPEPVAILASAAGVRRVETAEAVAQAVSAGTLCWIDIVAAHSPTQVALLSALGLDANEQFSMLRFGQAGRMTLVQNKLRVVTWLSDQPLAFKEVHVFRANKIIVTVWTGNAAALDDVRRQFAERASSPELEHSPMAAAAIILQLLLGTLDKAVSDIDTKLDAVSHKGETDLDSVNPSVLT